LNSVFELGRVKDDDTLIICVDVYEVNFFHVVTDMLQHDLDLMGSSASPKLAFDFASQLLDPTKGDLLLTVRDETGSQRKLYATSWILSTNSKYFAASTYPFNTRH
jgi:hypothetical protein